MSRLDGRVIVMVGGAGGIGTATSLRLARAGARVVVGDIALSAAETVAESIRAGGGEVIAAAFDLADPASIQRLFALGKEHFGGIDGTHVNAADILAGTQDSNAVDIDPDLWDHVIRVDLTGYFHATRAAVPLLLERGGGSIVYTSSTAAYVGEPQRVAYACAKAGVNALARHVASKWGKQNIRANVVAPGLCVTDTVMATLSQDFLDEMLARYRTPRLGVPDDIAVMVELLLSDDAGFIQGQVIPVNGGGFMH